MVKENGFRVKISTDLLQPVTELGALPLSKVLQCNGAPLRRRLELNRSRVFVRDDDETHEKCPRKSLRASRRNARVTVSIVGYGKRAFDEFSGRGHDEVRQGVCEGCEGG